MPNETQQSSVLQDELRRYRQHKQRWLPAHEGEFVVISGQTVAGFYPDYATGLRAGLQKFGLRAFLIKQVCAEELVYFIY